MKAPENENKKRGWFLVTLSRIFGGSATSGGASGAIGTASSGGFSGMLSGLGGLFASKAGIVGMVLGGATIAAGVGVVYNFIGPSSKPVYSPSLFENQYYEAEVEGASAKRAANYNADADASSSLDYFREQAKRDGMGFGEGEGGAVDEASADGADNLASGSADGAAEGDGNKNANASVANVPRLQKAPSFGSGGGGTQSKLTIGGSGMSGGIGSKFQKIYKAPTGQASSMNGSVASKINKAGKRSLSGFNKKGAYGQAKYAGKLGKKAAYSKSKEGAKTTAAEAFQGETGGEGDLGTPDMGVGIGGAGVSDGSGLKGSDPSLNDSSYTPPEPKGEADTGDPNKKWTDMALYGILAAALFIGITNILVKKAKLAADAATAAGVTPAAAALWAKAAALYGWARITGFIALAAAAVVTYAGVMLMGKEGQKWMGIMYTIGGAYLMYTAYDAMAGAGKDKAAAKQGAVKAAVGSAENGMITAEQSKEWGLNAKDLAGTGVTIADPV